MTRWWPLLLVLVALPAGAPPPIPPFPAALAPADGASAPSNTRLWAFGQGAPDEAQLGFSARIGAQPIDGELEALGAGWALTPSSALADGAEVDLVVTSPGGELSARFTARGARDDTPPTLDAAVVLDAPRGTLVIGVEGSDETGLAGFLALEGARAVSATPPGFVLEAAADAAGCATVVAVDLAGNRSSPARACAEVEADGGPPPPPGGGCPGCGGDAGLALLLGALALRRRRD